jgi:ribosome maturation factor RimP
VGHKSTGEEAVVSGPSTTKTSTDRLAAAVAGVLEQVAIDEGFDVEDVEVVPAGRRRLLRVIVDRDGGIDLDAVAAASRSFGAALDASTVMGDAAYVLEVSSPGIDRPLTAPRHWHRAVGRLVEAQLRSGEPVRGRVVAVDETTVTFDTEAGARPVALADLDRGHVQVEFSREGGS